MRLWYWARLAPVFVRSLGRVPGRHLWYMARRMRDENPHTVGGRVYVNSFFPPYPSQAYERFLEAVFAGRRVPFSTYLAVTHACPYRCGHCSYGRRGPGRLEGERIREAIEQIKSIGTITIGLTGGEPLLREDIGRIVRWIGKDTASVLFTTGHGLTAERAAELCEAGLDCLTVGLESDTAAEHDRVRGCAGSFEDGAAAVRRSVEAGMYTAVSTIATRAKIAGGTLERMARLAAQLGAHEFRILEPIPTGLAAGDAGMLLTEAESARAAELHRTWNRRGVGPAIASFSHLESAAMFGCGAGYHHLFVDAGGNVCPCDLTPLSMGNLLDEPLADIWRRMERWFGEPRRMCLMKEVCRRGCLPGDAAALPLGRAESEAICDGIPRGERLPTIFENLFSGRRPEDPPASRP